VQVIQIAQGARKLDGSPVQPWRDGSAEDQALRAFTARYYDMFVNAVARYRGLSAKTVRETDAAVFVGADAVHAGLATAVGPIELPMNELRALARGRPLMTSGRTTMDGDRLTRQQIETDYPEIVGAIRADAVKAVTKEQLVAQCPELVAALKADGLEAGKADLVKAERERITKIQDLGRTHPTIVKSSVEDGSSPEQAAVKILEADGATRARQLTLLQGDETGMVAPTPLAAGAAAGEGAQEPDPQLVAARAQQYIREQHKQGLSISVPDAVAHVRRGLGLPPFTTPAGA
jgi:ClpP class serine protease